MNKEYGMSDFNKVQEQHKRDDIKLRSSIKLGLISLLVCLILFIVEQNVAVGYKPFLLLIIMSFEALLLISICSVVVKCIRMYKDIKDMDNEE